MSDNNLDSLLVGSVSAKLKVDMQEFDSSMDSAEKRLKSFNVEMNKSSNYQLDNKVKSLNQNLKIAKSTLDTVSGTFAGGKNNIQAYGNMIDVSNRKIEVFARKLHESTEAVKGSEKAIKETSKTLNDAKDRYEALQKTEIITDEQKKELKEANDEVKKFERELRALTNTFNRAADNVVKYQVGVNNTTADVNKFTKEIEKTNKALLDQIDKTGTKLTVGLTVPVAGLGIVATKSAIDFESAFAGVRKTVEATEDEYSSLEKQIRNMSKYQVPTTAADISGVVELGGQLGIVNDNLIGFSKTIIDIKESTNLSLESAATDFAQFANITGMSQKDFDRLGSSVVELGNNFATTESDIVAMSMRLAGAGSTIGMTQPQIVATATAMSSLGIEAEAGGTAMSKTMINIAQAVSEGKEKLEKFAEVAGMSKEKFAEMFKTDSGAAITEFINRLGSAKDAGQDLFNILEGLGITEVRTRDAMLRLAGGGDIMANAMEMSNKAWSENTALTEEANKRYQTTESQLKMFKNTITDAGISFGKSLLPALQTSANAIKSLADGFSKLSPATKTVILTIGGLAIGLGPAIKLSTGLTRSMITLKSAFLTTGPSAISASTGITGVGTSSVVASVGVGAFGKALAIATGGLTLILPAVLGLASAFSAFNQEADETNESLTNFEDAVKSSREKIEQENTETVRSFNEMVSGVNAEVLRLSVFNSELSKESSSALLDKIKDVGEEAKRIVKADTDEMNALYMSVFSDSNMPDTVKSNLVGIVGEYGEVTINSIENAVVEAQKVVNESLIETGAITEEAYAKITEQLGNLTTTVSETVLGQRALTLEIGSTDINIDNYNDYYERIVNVGRAAIEEQEILNDRRYETGVSIHDKMIALSKSEGEALEAQQQTILAFEQAYASRTESIRTQTLRSKKALIDGLSNENKEALEQLDEIQKITKEYDFEIKKRNDGSMYVKNWTSAFSSIDENEAAAKVHKMAEALNNATEESTRDFLLKILNDYDEVMNTELPELINESMQKIGDSIEKNQPKVTISLDDSQIDEINKLQDGLVTALKAKYDKDYNNKNDAINKKLNAEKKLKFDISSLDENSLAKKQRSIQQEIAWEEDKNAKAILSIQNRYYAEARVIIDRTNLAISEYQRQIDEITAADEAASKAKKTRDNARKISDIEDNYAKTQADQLSKLQEIDEEYAKKKEELNKTISKAPSNTARIIAEQELNELTSKYNKEREGFALDNKDKLLQIQRQLDDEKLRQKEEAESEERKKEKARLQEQVKNLQDNAKQQLDVLSNKYDNESRMRENALQKEQEQLKYWHDEVTKQENLASQARSQILNNSQEDMLKLLQDYNDDFLKSGKTLGEMINQGLKEGLSLEEIKNQIESFKGSYEFEALNSLYGGSSTSGGTTGKSNINTQMGSTQTSYSQSKYNSFFNDLIKNKEAINRKPTNVIPITESEEKRVREAISNFIGSTSANITDMELFSLYRKNGIKLPQYATGGIVYSPQLAMIGEGGQPEAIIPMDKMYNFVNGILSGSREFLRRATNAMFPQQARSGSLQSVSTDNSRSVTNQTNVKVDNFVVKKESDLDLFARQIANLVRRNQPC